MRSLVCVLAITSPACFNATICLAQQAAGPVAPVNSPDAPGRPPSDLPAKDTDGPPPQVAPDDAAVKEAQELIKQVYEDDYKAAAKTPEPLIQKLLAAAEKTEEPARKYAMLLEAVEVAVLGGDHGRAIELIDVRASQFGEDGVEARLMLLAKLLTPKTKTDSEALATLFSHAIDTAEQGLEEGKPGGAKAAAAVAVSIAKAMQTLGKSKKLPELLNSAEKKLAEAQSLASKIQKRNSLLNAYQEALEELKAASDSPKANGVAGRWRCFVLGDWREGLPNLAKSDIEEIKEVAAEDLAVTSTQPPDPKKVAAVAGKWWNAAERVDPDDAEALKRHAGELYRSVADAIVDPLDSALAKKRAAQFEDGGTEGRRSTRSGPQPQVRNLPKVTWSKLGKAGFLTGAIALENVDIKTQRSKTQDFVDFFSQRDLATPVHGQMAHRVDTNAEGVFECFANDRGTSLAFYLQSDRPQACNLALTVAKWMGGGIYLNGKLIGKTKEFDGDGSSLLVPVDLAAGVNVLVFVCEMGNGGGRRATLRLDVQGIRVGY